MKNKLMFIGLTAFAGLNASEVQSYRQMITSAVSNAATSTQSFVAPYASKVATASKNFAIASKDLAFAAGTKVANGASYVKSNTWDKNLGYFKHDGKVATSAAVLATVGLSYATYKAYKNGFFSRFNPFGKATVVAEEVTAPVVEEVAAPVVVSKRTTRNNIRWN